MKVHQQLIIKRKQGDKPAARKGTLNASSRAKAERRAE
jgi:hypothetical protein